MNTLLRHISHLLVTDRYVGVEGIGAFSLTQRCASLSADSTLSAPSLTITFDAAAAVSDSALIASVVRAEGISEKEAADKVGYGTDALKSALSRGEHIEIAGLATLSLDTDSGTLSLDSRPLSWLRPVAVRPIVTQPADNQVAAANAAIENRRNTMNRFLRRTASSAAFIAVFALMAFIISHLPSRQSIAPQIASVGIEKLTAPNADSEMQLAAPAAAEPTLVLILNTPSDGCSPAKIRRHNKEEQSASLGRYCLIVASLASRSEADKYLAAHSTTDMPLTLLENDGRWRIYALSAPTIEELSSAGRNLGVYERYPSAWICRR